MIRSEFRQESAELRIRSVFVTANDVLVIGAGPYGLSVSAHLRAMGVGHLIVGRAMETWRAHMPTGMHLKSEPYGSDIASPAAGHDIEAYCRSHELEYAARLGPLSLERFLGYTDWYTAQLVPDVTDLTVTDVSQAGGCFRVAFADADPIIARQVIVATGILPYAVIPAEVSDLPSDLVSHTSEHRDLARFAGRRIAVLGGGQSALETAALLREAGADTQLVLRREHIDWLTANPSQLSWFRRAFRPITKTCEGWRCLAVDSPRAFGLLPEGLRVTKARTVLGPAGAWWLKDRVEGMVDVLPAHHLRGAVVNGSGLRILLDGPRRSSLEVEHLIAGTGFRVDIGRLGFLSDGLQANIATVNRYPIVARDGMSSVPGLYFAGVPAAVSLGPSVRFISGTHNTALHIARSVSRRTRRNAGSAPVRTAVGADPSRTCDGLRISDFVSAIAARPHGIDEVTPLAVRVPLDQGDILEL